MIPLSPVQIVKKVGKIESREEGVEEVQPAPVQIVPIKPLPGPEHATHGVGEGDQQRAEEVTQRGRAP